MPTFTAAIGSFFDRYTSESNFKPSDFGRMMVCGDPVRKVTVNDDRSVTVDVWSDYTNRYQFDRDALMQAKPNPHGGYTVALPSGDTVNVAFMKDVSREAMQELTGQLYDYD